MTIDLSIVVPIYNEEESIGPLFAAVVEGLKNLDMNYEIICIDDGSKDNSFKVLTEIAAHDARMKYVKFRRNAGQTAAMRAGIEFARGRLIATMDGDLQNDPADIPKLLEKMEEGYDLVVGWRINRQDKWLSRKLPSRVANWIIGKVTGLPIRDNGCSLKLYKASVIKKVPLYSDMHRFIPAMAMTEGASVAQIGVRHHARQFGESKYGLSRVFKVILDLFSIKMLILFAARPMRSFSGIAAFTFLISFIIMALAAFHQPDEATIVLTTATILIFSLALFLLLLGSVAAIAYRRGDISSDPSNY